jgi:hypothetical protein
MIIYLASPYSHPDPAVRQQRFEIACTAVLKLMAEGHHIYSPIVHNHSLAIRGDLQAGWEFWKAFDEKMVAACGELWVLRAEGWVDSKGIEAEIDIAARLGIPVRFI